MAYDDAMVKASNMGLWVVLVVDAKGVESAISIPGIGFLRAYQIGLIRDGDKK